MKLQPVLADLLRQAYSAEKAAAFAYQGHAGAVKNGAEKVAIRQIEIDEWNHRQEVRAIMAWYGIRPSRWYEIRFHVIGKIISGSCYVIGWFMPFYFAGRLESGNVCEYFRMKQYFNALGIQGPDLESPFVRSQLQLIGALVLGYALMNLVIARDPERYRDVLAVIIAIGLCCIVIFIGNVLAGTLPALFLINAVLLTIQIAIVAGLFPWKSRGYVR